MRTVTETIHFRKVKVQVQDSSHKAQDQEE